MEQSEGAQVAPSDKLIEKDAKPLIPWRDLMTFTPDLGDVPGWISALSTVSALGIAGYAAKAAFHQVKEARNLREAQAQPFVVIDFEPTRGVGHPFMDLVIKNVGQTMARDVRFKFSPELLSTLYEDPSAPTKLSDLSVFTNGIASIPPGREYRILFDKMPDRFANPKMPRQYAVEISFGDYKGVPQEPLTQILDLEVYFSALMISEHGTHHIAKTLRAWAKKNGVTHF
ncbi:hypothetical protein [Micromonospora sp. NPDC049359]|uniref:hypothetical protein n=1 Tax=unclassified Micromonospora TaxID=2617518 RepID=UPI0037B73869